MNSKSNILFPDPSLHPEWISPHSPEWYSQLNDTVGEYSYPRKSTIDQPTAEMIFSNLISSFITKESKILLVELFALAIKFSLLSIPITSLAIEIH
jgi:hypothetical protein